MTCTIREATVADTALILDGLRLLDGRSARISARHNRRTATNILFADGHCQTLPEKSLPSDDSIFDSMNATALTQRWPFPRWRMDQP